ncbi:YggT family protein [Atopobacter phocae]|uniref:YggT family protein n=1 Tax=Atopobacter phocae TaxID=136492 RepID=UPI000472A8C4|nr:YggT family protein [Atopobacter phocae]
MIQLVFSGLNFLITVYIYMLVIYALLSWFPNARHSKLGQWITQIVAPYLDILDQYIPSFGGISFSVVIGVLLLQFAQRGLMIVMSWFI